MKKLIDFKKLFLVVLVTVFILSCATTSSHWQAANKANTIEAYEAFLKKHPKSEHAPQARVRLNELYEQRDWRQVRQQDTVAAYENFLRKYPNGVMSSQARTRLDELKGALLKEWQKAQATNTIAAYREFLNRYPQSEFAAKARQYLTTQKVEGWVQKVNEKASNINIKTTMGQQETLFLNSDVKVSRRGSPLTLKDLKSGESIMIEYNSLPGKAIGKTISVGYSVSHCSCGSSCSCPLSRGCRVIKY